MNGTPRVLNRILLFIVGIKLLAIGIFMVLLAAVPAVGQRWHGWAGAAWDRVDDLFRRTRLPGREESWLWIVAAVVLLVVIVGMVAWVSQQGKGRANLLVSDLDGSDVDGDVRIGGGLAEQALKAALAERHDLASATVATYEFRGTPCLRVRIQPRQGVAPQLLAAEVSLLVEALDAVMGKKTPVLVHIAGGTRVRLTRAERVR